MYNIFSALSDIIVIIFDLLLYTHVTTLKDDKRSTRAIMWGSCAGVLAVYFMAVYAFHMPVALSSFIFVTLPSFLIFWLLSKYKDARFFTTFCFVDTISLIIGFLSRTLGYFGGLPGAIAGCALMLAIFLPLYLKARPFFSGYRKLLESVQQGWTSIMVSTLLVYFLLIFTATYPKPMVQRPEYFLLYGAISLTVLSFYVVLIASLFQKKRLYELNQQLTKEKKWHHIAYVDGLTQLRNRMAYIERINELSREKCTTAPIYAVMIDMDDFKKINDTLGHHVGDIMLQKAAEILRRTFAEETYSLFRIGGDEFAVIAAGVSEAALEALLRQLNAETTDQSFEFSYGYSKVNPEENNAMENAFIRADSAMYRQKRPKKPIPSTKGGRA